MFVPTVLISNRNTGMMQSCRPVCVFHRQRYLKRPQNIYFFFNLVLISHPIKHIIFVFFLNSLAINDANNITIKNFCSQNTTSAAKQNDHIFVFPFTRINAITNAPRCENYYIVVVQREPNNVHISYLLRSKTF